jgi:GNAT superfamily N-acetyltransferase
MDERIRVSMDKGDIDVEAVRHYLNDLSYWAKDRSMDVIQKSIANSRCYSLLSGGAFIGFARMVTDYATFAYLCDVFILPEFQGKGCGSVLLKAVTEDAELAGMRHYLFTRDAFGFYEHFGYKKDEVLATKLMARG